MFPKPLCPTPKTTPRGSNLETATARQSGGAKHLYASPLRFERDIMFSSASRLFSQGAAAANRQKRRLQ
jgi:hypothetical protein